MLNYNNNAIRIKTNETVNWAPFPCKLQSSPKHLEQRR